MSPHRSNRRVRRMAIVAAGVMLLASAGRGHAQAPPAAASAPSTSTTSSVGLLPVHAISVDLGTLPGGLGSDAYAITDNGLVTGSSDNAARDFVYAFLWKSGEFLQLPRLPGGYNAAGFAANERGMVVGQAVDASGEARAVLWTNAPE